MAADRSVPSEPPATRAGSCSTTTCSWRRARQSLFAAAERQRADLRHIRSYYALEHRIGVRVDLGLRVRHAGRPGTIIDTRGQYLVLRLDDETVPVTVHATSGMEYQGKDGWVRAVPLPDPCPAV
jgi:hypothetical protein